MNIWKKDIDLNKLEQTLSYGMGNHIGIRVTEFGSDYIKGTMSVDERTHQPFGILHGGASVVLAESLGSIGGNLSVDDGYHCVGVEVNANHLAAVKSGVVEGIAKPLHLGRSTQVWEIKIYSEDKKLVCASRLTLAVVAIA